MRFRFAAVAAVCCLTAITHAQLPSSPIPAAVAPAVAPAADGRHPEEGRPFIRTYAPLDVNAAGQNWSMVQDSRGVIYVGSQSGVIEFDGVSWRLIETQTLATVRSLAIDEAGVIYAGAQLDFGYLTPDDSGTMTYKSLADQVPPDARGFTDVWRTWATKSGVLFQTEQAVFRWANNTMTVVRPPGGSIPPHWHKVADEIFFVHRGSGVVELGGQQRRIAAGATVFIPKNVRVTLRNTGTEPLSLAFFFSKPGFETLLRDMSAPEGQPFEPLSEAELSAIRKKHESHTVYERP